jgi:hypothetical protein
MKEIVLHDIDKLNPLIVQQFDSATKVITDSAIRMSTKATDGLQNIQF